MGLTCSVLGHEYGERDHIEERDRQGSEEVIAIREVKTCVRCGDELVVSESKEVLAVEEEEDVEPEPIPVAEEPTEPPIEEAEAIDPEPQEMDEGIILTDNDDGREPGQWPPMEHAEESESTEEIEWPEAPQKREDSPEESDPGPWPDPEGEDEGYDASVDESDPEIAAQVIESASSAGDTDVEETDAGFFRAGSIDSPADPDDGDVHTEFFCPRCDWSARSLTTSVRRGDICPNCRTGYISERDE